MNCLGRKDHISSKRVTGLVSTYRDFYFILDFIYIRIGNASMSNPDCVSPHPGICPVNRDTIDYLLSKNGSGNAIIIVVGGAAESLSSMPGKNAVTLRNRKGFVKLALRHG